MLRLILCLTILVSLPTVHAQQAPVAETSTSQFGPRRQIATIIYMGLAGAVLGLSTLSFYGRPQDHLTNIPVGFGVGVVVGTIYMTYQAATNPSEFYKSQTPPNLREHQPVPLTTVADLYLAPPQSQVGYRWSF